MAIVVRVSLCALALALTACAKDSPHDADPTHTGTNTDAGGTDADGGLAADGDASHTGSAGNRPPPTSTPSGCVQPGELNEFFLPECPEVTELDASVPIPDCVAGFDEFGRPVCLDDAGIPKPPAPPACIRGGLCQELVLTGGGQLDVLFMVDNSGSMREEQAALVQEMPALITVLTSGDADGDGSQDFPAIKDLHVGVISSDMGLPGIYGITGCSGLGDDGMLKNLPSASVTGCATSYPKFLSYDASLVDPNQAALDFECIATLGTDGCGFEQQLESALKAVTPATADTRFMTDPPSAAATTGHADGLNAGFLRRESLVALIVVTDEDDCSAREPRLFTPQTYLNVDDPLYAQDLNLRCFYNQASLFEVSRYVSGYSELRPPGSNLVLFAAIVGVPPALVDDAARASVDFDDASERNAYYDALLAAPGMQAMPDPTRPAGNGNLIPSCDTATGRAYPPRRIVQVAKGLGRNALVQSICQSSFAPAMAQVVERISESLTVGCLPDALTRNAKGRVRCDVIWELPAPGTPGATLERCEERGFLITPEDRNLRTTADGRTRCRVNQVPVTTSGGTTAPTAGASGFYYDDFTSQAVDQCGAGSAQRVVFTSDVTPPIDVRVYVDCEP